MSHCPIGGKGDDSCLLAGFLCNWRHSRVSGFGAAPHAKDALSSMKRVESRPLEQTGSAESFWLPKQSSSRQASGIRPRSGLSLRYDGLFADSH